MKRLLLLAAVATLLSACGGGNAAMQERVAEIKKRPGGRIEPLPEIKPYETYNYDPAGIRSPFEPGDSGAGAAGGIRPDSSRTREFLEQYSLDTLRMVGTLRQGGRVFGLVQTKDGLVHRVATGNYLGQADGRITAITEAKISLTEIVPDGLGGFIERQANIGLSN
jgi:type IV pilus assembly protein PilP